MRIKRLNLPSPLASFSLGLFLFVLALFIIHYSLAQSAKLGLFIRVASAAENPIPSPTVPCDDTASPEFHSLRPYQASPCRAGVADEALFCGNDLVLKDTIPENKSQATRCEDIGGGKERCYFHEDRNAGVAIDLSGADLPIAGNTEGVRNSQKREDDPEFNDAVKINDYVSWYLNGVTNRAEYPFVGTKDPQDIKKIVDFSGPLNKLLPQEIQWISRSETVKKAVAGKERHNQVVGCTSLVGGIPLPCTGIFNQLVGKPHRLSDWENHTPPLREDFKTFEEYWQAVQHWRGKFCPRLKVPSFIPFIGEREVLLLCGLENPFSPNYYAKLFSYIPYSSTEDREGSVEVETVSPQQQGDVTVSNISFSDQDPAELFFAHMEELNGLADILQSTFVPKGEEKLGEATLKPRSSSSSCDLAQIRTNPGDNLFAGEIAGDLKYTADFSCDFTLPEGSGASCIPVPGQAECPIEGKTCNANGRCVPSTQNPSCSKDVFVNLSLITKTPLADEVYSRLVEGPASVFRRLFPKIGDGGPLAHLLDIPAATKVEYKSVSGPQVVQAGNPGNERGGESAELYFPHLGSVSEYFLKGIQTLLRPKGFGEPILSGQSKTGEEEGKGQTAVCKRTGQPGSYPELPKASGACKVSVGSNPVGLNLPTELVKIVEAAAAAFKVPPSLILATMYIEGNWSYKPLETATNADIKNWATGCASVPNCSAEGFFSNPDQGVFPWLHEEYWNTLKDAVGVVDPNREPNPCNLMDTIFAQAKNLSTNHTGSTSFAGKTCFGIPLNAGSGRQSSCSWSKSAVETSSKMYGNGVADRCLTVPGSCSSGDTTGCGSGFNDTCETLQSWSSGSGSSQNACIWNVYQSYK